MQNLIEFHNWNHTRPLPVVHFCPLLWIERLAYENVQHFARTRLPFAHDLGVVKVELRFAVAPVTVVLQKCRRKLRG